MLKQCDKHMLAAHLSSSFKFGVLCLIAFEMQSATQSSLYIPGMMVFISIRMHSVINYINFTNLTVS